jgi:protocatechuate 3,4-dioxygenase beta subunit
MPPESRLHGRLLDSNSKPAAGVRVEVSGIDDQLDPDPQNWVPTTDRLELQRSRLSFAVVTDSDGRFVLAGLPPGYRIVLLANDRRFARKSLSCATIDKLQIDRLNKNQHVSPESMLLADGFTATLRPAQTIRGQVIYGDQGKPAVGAHVAMGLYGTFTDSEGRYSLQGWDTARQGLLSVTPPEGGNYLAATAVVAPVNMPTQQLNFALEPGSVITGQLREQETGQPLRVPYVHVHYQSEEPKRARASTRTRADGSFRIVVPPGKGRLLTYDSLPGYLPRDLIGAPGPPQRDWQPIEIKPGQTLAGKDFFFTRGMVVQGQVRDAEGKPVAGAVFCGVTEQQPSAGDGSFTLRGLSPEHKSHFLVVQGQRKLGAELTIEPRKESNPVRIDVKLRHTQSAIVRVVDENQQPVADAQVWLLANLKTHEGATGFGVRSLPVCEPLRTDAAGTCTLPHLVVGGSYSVHALHWGYTAAQADFRVEAGRKPEVPDLVLMANTLPLAGRVVDATGKPIAEVEVSIARLMQTPDHHTMAQGVGSTRTDRDGRFHFFGLPKGEYQLLATLSKPTGMTDASGRPASKSEARTELRVESGKEDLRIVLQVP